MNKQRRKMINANVNALETIKSTLENILADEQEYFDNMPENLQGSIRGMDSEDAISILEDAVEKLEDCIDGLNNIG